jgi:hypothetical protein
MPQASGRLNDPDHWRNRAEEARVIAEQMIDPEAREFMLGVADHYEEFAERAERRRIARDSR